MKTLSKIDCKALKGCTDLSFRLKDGKTTAECLNKVHFMDKEKNPFARDILYSFEVESNLRDYAKGPKEGARYEGFCSQGYRGDIGGGEIDLLAYILKEGWTIRAEWTCGNTSPKMEEEGKVNSFLTLKLFNKTGKRAGGFKYKEATDFKNRLNHICYRIN